MVLARTVDTAEKAPGPSKLLGGLIGYPGLIWRNRYMVQNFFRRELMSRFHGSFLGAWWMLVQPLFLFAVYFLVFGVLYGDYKTGEGPDPRQAIYLFSGVIVFHSLIEATSTACNVVVANGNLVKKVAFPSEALPLPSSMVSIVVYLIGAVVCLGLGLGLGALSIGWELLYLPLVIVVQFALTLGMGLLLANANVFIRDVSQVWRIVGQAWMFVSPVFWYPQMLLQKFESTPWVPQLMFAINPMTPLLQCHRIAMGGEHPDQGIVDFWGNLGIAAAWALGFMVLGYTSFAASKHKYADVV
ncbi:MAG: ABC transporter permease [Planctomycetes bacterium]|nr:ABC transporter permease [Planctomycetota bacterium]